MQVQRMAGAMVAVVAALIVAGCSGEPDPEEVDGGTDAGVPPEQTQEQAARAWCTSVAAVYCDHLIACGLADPNEKLLCGEVMRRQVCQQAESVALGALTFNAQAAQACLDGFRDFVGKCDGEDPESDACEDVFVPAAGVGDRCQTSSDCAEDRTVCLGPQCGAICLATGGANQPCFNHACNDGLWCDNQTGTCQVPGAEGDACSDASFNSPQCAEGTRCNGSTCVALPTAGEDCFTGFQHSCAPGHYCAGLVCEAHLEAGDACTSVASCGPDRTCRGGVCEAREAEGGSCSVNNDCRQGLLCRMGTCAPRSEEGEPCGVQGHCMDGLNCDSVTYTCEVSRQVVAGEPCTNSAITCRYDAHCEGIEPGTSGDPGTPGTCTQRTIGSPCTAHYECPEASHCADDNTCQPAGDGTPCGGEWNCLDQDYCDNAGVCVPRVGAGESCEFSSACQLPMRCLGHDGTSGTCGMPGGEGATCVEGEDLDCRFPFVCVSGFCARGMGVGQPCFESMCVDAACDRDSSLPGDGTCVPLRQDGAACGTPFDCASGACFQNICVPACL